MGRVLICIYAWTMYTRKKKNDRILYSYLYKLRVYVPYNISVWYKERGDGVYIAMLS